MIDLCSRVETAITGLVAPLVPGVEVRDFNDNEDDERQQVAVKAEKGEEAPLGVGCYQLECSVRMRNLTADQINAMELLFVDSKVFGAELRTVSAANSFLLPGGSTATMFDGGWLRSGAGPDKTQAFVFSLFAQAEEIGIDPTP